MKANRFYKYNIYQLFYLNKNHTPEIHTICQFPVQTTYIYAKELSENNFWLISKNLANLFNFWELSKTILANSQKFSILSNYWEFLGKFRHFFKMCQIIPKGQLEGSTVASTPWSPVCQIWNAITMQCSRKKHQSISNSSSFSDHVLQKENTN